MSNTKKNLGHVTAYAYYKAGGGTMTEEEFTEYMADFGDAAERAVDAASEAAQSKTDAQTAAATATDKADIATTAATSASGSATSASQSATTATSAASTATNAATTATNAKNDAVNAKTAAQTAKTAAETAATTATTKAGEASTSATNAAASAQSVASSAAQIATNTADISSLKEDLNENVSTLGNELFSETPTELRQSSEGYRINGDGYRVADANYKLDRYRVFAGDTVKVVSDDRWQFQSITDVPASGTQNIIGEKHGAGTIYTTVPEGAGYVVLSTPITGSGASVNKTTSNVDSLNEGIDGLNDEVGDLGDNIPTLGDAVFSGTELTSVQTSEGWKLDDNGYRVADADYQLIRFRVFAGDTVKVVSDHKWQFQTSTTVTGSGTQYKVGRTRGTGIYYMEVPDTVPYVVLSTTINGSGAHTYHVTSDIEDAADNIDAIKADNELNFSAVLNAYTSQVSDIPYPLSVTHITIGIDTANEKFVSGSGHALVIPIISGTSIRVTKPQTTYCQVCFTSDYPTANVDITHRTNMNSVGNTEFVAESQATDNYLVVYTHSTEIAVADCTFAYSQTARGTVELLPQLDTYMINLLKYRPVGKISKPYIAITCDDGLEPLATYTLPRIQYWNNYYDTDIPLHMALFDNSPVLLNAEYTALVTDMCENHNCSIGIHGTQPYTVYSSPTALYAYLKKQEATIIDKTGVIPTSVVYPHDSYTDQIMVMAGGFCGICASSSSTPKAYKYVDASDRYYYVGEKTNLYEVPRVNISDTRIGSVAELKNVIDYAYEHNYVICPYFHDIDFTEHSEEANQFARTMFDTLIQYGMEKGIEFINFGDIRYLT